MADAWNGAWGSAWSSSWGSGAAVVPPSGPVRDDTGLVLVKFTREKYRRLIEEIFEKAAALTAEAAGQKTVKATRRAIVAAVHKAQPAREVDLAAIWAQTAERLAEIADSHDRYARLAADVAARLIQDDDEEVMGVLM